MADESMVVDAQQPAEPGGGPAGLVDPRGQRFSAAVSSAVLAVTLGIGVMTDPAAVLLTLQGLVFGVPAMFGLRWQPLGWLFRALIRPRLGPPAHLEPEQPPRFAQGVGFAFVVVAMVGIVLGVEALAFGAVALALVATFLNAAFGFCLGCQLYLLLRRAIPDSTGKSAGHSDGIDLSDGADLSDGVDDSERQEPDAAPHAEPQPGAGRSAQ